MHYSEQFSEKLEICREIYLKYEGKNHELIEKEMRERGYHDFHRRNLYRRFERGTHTPGWPETYGWDWLVKLQKEAAAKEAQRVLKDHGNSPLLDTDKADKNVSDTSPSASSAVKPPPLPTDLPSFDELKNWLKRTWPAMNWEWKHQVLIYKHLRRVWDGDCKRLMIFVPPRHGKSELVTVRFPAWCLKQDPKLNIIVGSYNQRLADRFSRKIRNALADDAILSSPQPNLNADKTDGAEKADKKRYSDPSDPPDQRKHAVNIPRQNASPADRFIRTRTKNSESEWETAEGGGVKAVGVGAGVTGYGADLIIIDDPVKSRAEAESETFRDRVYDWFNDDLYTRLEPNGKIILIQTRWHEDDLAGRLLREAAEEDGEHWDVISLPALAEPEAKDEGRAMSDEFKDEGRDMRDEKASPDSTLVPHLSSLDTPSSLDALGRKPGEALCPERFDEEKLTKIRKRLGSYSFAALYQQRPRPAEGGLFKRAWFRILNSAPPNLKWKRGYDLGISKSADADYTASLRVAYDDAGNVYIADGFRRRIEYPEQRRYILGRIESERDTEHGIELSANGNAVVQDLRTEQRVRGRPLRGVKVKGDKVTRALPWIALAEEGKVFLIRGAWNTEFIDEAASFPAGTHDDQIDAVSIAISMHREPRYRSLGF